MFVIDSVSLYTLQIQVIFNTRLSWNHKERHLACRLAEAGKGNWMNAKVKVKQYLEMSNNKVALVNL